MSDKRIYSNTYSQFPQELTVGTRVEPSRVSRKITNGHLRARVRKGDEEDNDLFYLLIHTCFAYKTRKLHLPLYCNLSVSVF